MYLTMLDVTGIMNGTRNDPAKETRIPTIGMSMIVASGPFSAKTTP